MADGKNGENEDAYGSPEGPQAAERAHVLRLHALPRRRARPASEDCREAEEERHVHAWLEEESLDPHLPEHGCEPARRREPPDGLREPSQPHVVDRTGDRRAESGERQAAVQIVGRLPRRRRLREPVTNHRKDRTRHRRGREAVRLQKAVVRHIQILEPLKRGWGWGWRGWRA